MPRPSLEGATVWYPQPRDLDDSDYIGGYLQVIRRERGDIKGKATMRRNEQRAAETIDVTVIDPDETDVDETVPQRKRPKKDNDCTGSGLQETKGVRDDIKSKATVHRKKERAAKTIDLTVTDPDETEVDEVAAELIRTRRRRPAGLSEVDNLLALANGGVLPGSASIHTLPSPKVLDENNIGPEHFNPTNISNTLMHRRNVTDDALIVTYIDRLCDDLMSHRELHMRLPPGVYPTSILSDERGQWLISRLKELIHAIKPLVNVVVPVGLSSQIAAFYFHLNMRLMTPSILPHGQYGALPGSVVYLSKPLLGNDSITSSSIDQHPILRFGSKKTMTPFIVPGNTGR